MNHDSIVPRRIDLQRREVLQAALALGACALSPTARACEFFTTNLTIIHPWARASAAGTTSAIVCMSFQDVTTTDRWIGASSPVADSVEMGGEGGARGAELVIPAGRTTVLSETGAHLRLLGLRHPLLLGRQYPMTLVFAIAGTVQAQLTIDYARFG
jgi:copper(I)-binding protein